MRFAALAVLVTGLAWSTNSAQTQTPAPTGTGVIAGRVVEADSNRPVPEAIVALQGRIGNNRRVMADEQGRFAFVNLAADQYALTADQFGYAVGAYGRSRPEGVPRIIRLADDQRLFDANLLLWRYAAITGRVLDETGEPVSRVTVRALRRTTTFGRLDLSPASTFSASTDDRGVYRLARLTPGDYAVMVSA